MRRLLVLALLFGLLAAGCIRTPLSRARVFHPKELDQNFTVEFLNPVGIMPDLRVIYRGLDVGKVTFVTEREDGFTNVGLQLRPGVAIPAEPIIKPQAELKLGRYILITQKR